MKTSLSPTHRRRSQRGSAVIIVLALLAIMLALVTANAVAVHSLNRELQLLDNKQKRHLEHSGGK